MLHGQQNIKIKYAVTLSETKVKIIQFLSLNLEVT